MEHPVIFSLNLGPREPKCRIILTVPPSVGLTATTSAGSIGVEGLRTKKVEINATAGSVRLSSIETDLTVGTTAGSIQLEDCRGAKNISTTAGSITIENAAGAIEARSTDGITALPRHPGRHHRRLYRGFDRYRGLRGPPGPANHHRQHLRAADPPDG